MRSMYFIEARRADSLPLQKQRYCHYGIQIENELSMGKYGAIIVSALTHPNVRQCMKVRLRLT